MIKALNEDIKLIELQPLYAVVLRNGEEGIVARGSSDQYADNGIALVVEDEVDDTPLVGIRRVLKLSDYNVDLSCALAFKDLSANVQRPFDIDEVYGYHPNSNFSFVPDVKNRPLIWSRRKIVRLTLEELVSYAQLGVDATMTGYTVEAYQPNVLVTPPKYKREVEEDEDDDDWDS